MRCTISNHRQKIKYPQILTLILLSVFVFEATVAPVSTNKQVYLDQKIHRQRRKDVRQPAPSVPSPQGLPPPLHGAEHPAGGRPHALPHQRGVCCPPPRSAPVHPSHPYRGTEGHGANHPKSRLKSGTGSGTPTTPQSTARPNRVGARLMSALSEPDARHRSAPYGWTKPHPSGFKGMCGEGRAPPVPSFPAPPPTGTAGPSSGCTSWRSWPA